MENLDSYFTNYVDSLQMIPCLLQSQISNSLHSDLIQNRMLGKINESLVNISKSVDFERSLSEIISSLLVLNEIFDGKISDMNDLEENLEKISIFLLSSKATVLVDDAQKLRNLTEAFKAAATTDYNNSHDCHPDENATDDCSDKSCDPRQVEKDSKTMASTASKLRQQRIHLSSSDLLLRGTKWITTGRRRQHRVSDLRCLKSLKNFSPGKTRTNFFPQKDTGCSRKVVSSSVTKVGQRFLATGHTRLLPCTSRFQSYNRKATRINGPNIDELRGRRVSRTVLLKTSKCEIESNSDDCETDSDTPRMENDNRSSRSSPIPLRRKNHLEELNNDQRKRGDKCTRILSPNDDLDVAFSNESSSSEISSKPSVIKLNSHVSSNSVKSLTNQTESILQPRTPQKRCLKSSHTTSTSKSSDIRLQSDIQSVKRVETRAPPSALKAVSRSATPHSQQNHDDCSKSEESSNSEDGVTPAVGEKLYCLCKKVSFGEMIACDNRRCPVEWFHFSCVDIRVQPKGKWFCPHCRGDTSKCRRLDS